MFYLPYFIMSITNFISTLQMKGELDTLFENLGVEDKTGTMEPAKVCVTLNSVHIQPSMQWLAEV